MTVHIVGSGIASLAAAYYLIEDAKVEPSDITIYEEDVLGGAMDCHTVPVLSPGPVQPKFAYVLPATRILEREYRCAFELFSHFASISDPNQTLEEDVREFNTLYPYEDATRLLDKAHQVLSSRHLGVGWVDRLRLVSLMLTPERRLDDVTIQSRSFTPEFYTSEFWLAWSTMMGPLPEHSAIEMRRYLWRMLHIVPDVATMTTVWRMRMNQNDSVAHPISDWLRSVGVNFPPNTHVDDVTFSPDDAVATSIAVKTAGGVKPIPVDSRDVVLMTLGSQVADMTIGSMKAPAQHLPPNPGECWALWQKIAKGRPQFGNPDKFFGPLAEGRAMWVTFTVTMNDPTFLNCLSVLTGTDPSRAGLITLTDSPWKITIAPLPKPHFSGQPDDTMVLWGYSITPEQPGTYVGGKPMDTCSGSEILTETIRHLGFDNYLVKILGTSVCIPCVLPRAGSVWLKRCQADRPKVFPDGAKNFAFIGQFCELPKDTMFTMEYSVRSAREAVSRLFHLPDRSPPVYQGWQDPQALFAAFKTLCL